MAAKSMKATQSSSALKIAASMTLKDATRGTAVSKDLSMLRLPSGAAIPGDQTTRSGTGLDATRIRASVMTVLEDEQDTSGQGRHLARLADKVDGIGAILEGEAQAHRQQSALVEELHEDQMKRLDEISFEINGAIADLTVYMDDFIQSSRGLLEGTFAGLNSDLRQRIDGLLPRLRELEGRHQAVTAGLEAERAARARETTEFLVPLREQIEKVASDLEREQKVREKRNAELQEKMEQAVASLDAALDTEIDARAQRVTATAKEWQHDQDQLARRQDKLEQGLEALGSQLVQETNLEKEQRMGAQDPIVEALASFIQKFQANAHEQSHLGK
uniref:Uncharacterized protein n=1 Tax=Alexandrium catenella TaxID=2925 RepID=A0A7S1SD51_ALECA|mmetsp:Transcript_95708/g.254135  ORF Transcript_95708/g.254135 Transcript_95708/m.254135 type:complete len:332 (+) Transcript_95708:53-1048(+)